MEAIHILRPGTFRGHAFDAAAITSLAEGYDPSLHEAPIVVGHPADGAPAYGWIASLAADADGLHATPRDVAPELAEAVGAGRYRKVSASLYPPGAAHHPAPDSGRWYLRHVGFLGGQAPVVKGLKPVALAEDAGAVTVELPLAEDPWIWSTIARLFRGLRDRLIDEADLETADRVLPDHHIDALAREAERAVDEPAAAPAFAEPPTAQEDDMATAPRSAAPAPETADLAEREAALDARQAELDARAMSLDARDARHATREATDFAERLVSEGRILPRDQAPLTALLAAVPATGDPTVEFSEDGSAAATARPAGAYLRHLLAGLPVQVDYAERAGAGRTPPASTSAAGLTLPRGYTVDPESDAAYRRIVDLAEREKIPFEAAAARIAQGA